MRYAPASVMKFSWYLNPLPPLLVAVNLVRRTLNHLEPISSMKVVKFGTSLLARKVFLKSSASNISCGARTFQNNGHSLAGKNFLLGNWKLVHNQAPQLWLSKKLSWRHFSPSKGPQFQKNTSLASTSSLEMAWYRKLIPAKVSWTWGNTGSRVKVHFSYCLA